MSLPGLAEDGVSPVAPAPAAGVQVSGGAVGACCAGEGPQAAQATPHAFDDGLPIALLPAVGLQASGGVVSAGRAGGPCLAAFPATSSSTEGADPSMHANATLPPRVARHSDKALSRGFESPEGVRCSSCCAEIVLTSEADRWFKYDTCPNFEVCKRCWNEQGVWDLTRPRKGSSTAGCTFRMLGYRVIDDRGRSPSPLPEHHPARCSRVMGGTGKRSRKRNRRQQQQRQGSGSASSFYRGELVSPRSPTHTAHRPSGWVGQAVSPCVGELGAVYIGGGGVYDTYHNMVN